MEREREGGRGGDNNMRTVDLKLISYYCHELSTLNMVALPFFLEIMKRTLFGLAYTAF